MSHLIFECAICLDENNNTHFTLECEHKFHLECLKKLLDNSLFRNISCPLCRSKISILYKRKVFLIHCAQYLKTFFNSNQQNGIEKIIRNLQCHKMNEKGVLYLENYLFDQYNTIITKLKNENNFIDECIISKLNLIKHIHTKVEHHHNIDLTELIIRDILEQERRENINSSNNNTYSDINSDFRYNFAYNL